MADSDAILLTPVVTVGNGKPTVELVKLSDGTDAVKITTPITEIKVLGKDSLERERNLLVKSRDGLQTVIDKLDEQLALFPEK